MDDLVLIVKANLSALPRLEYAPSDGPMCRAMFDREIATYDDVPFALRAIGEAIKSFGLGSSYREPDKDLRGASAVIVEDEDGRKVRIVEQYHIVTDTFTHTLSVWMRS
jgi:hypothetical protein